MNKSVIMLCAAICSVIGAYIPVLLGEGMFGGWSVLGGFLGGLCGVWLGAWASKRYGG